jgi:hypothetical protein
MKRPTYHLLVFLQLGHLLSSLVRPAAFRPLLTEGLVLSGESDLFKEYYGILLNPQTVSIEKSACENNLFQDYHLNSSIRAWAPQFTLSGRNRRYQFWIISAFQRFDHILPRSYTGGRYPYEEQAEMLNDFASLQGWIGQGRT